MVKREEKLHTKMAYLFQKIFGTKKIKENSKLKEIDIDIYDAVNLKSINFNIDFEFDYYIPFLKRHSFLLSNRSKVFVSKNILEKVAIAMNKPE